MYEKVRGAVAIGRKGKYEEWLAPDKLVLIQGWARDGLTDEQIAHNIGCAVGTLYAWKDKYHEFSEALKKGKEVVDFEVENALLNRALTGDTTAQIFWLKNRRPDKWRDKQEQNLSLEAGGNGVPIEITFKGPLEEWSE